MCVVSMTSSPSKRCCLYIAMFVSMILYGQRQISELSSIPPYQANERLDYLIHYGWFDIGKVHLSVHSIQQRRDTFDVFHVVGTGYTTGMAAWFMTVKDRYESYIDKETALPIEFIRDVDEGGYTIKRHVFFHHADSYAIDTLLSEKGKKHPIPPFAQDIFSAFYFARHHNLRGGIRKGDFIEIPVFLDHKIFVFRLKFMGRAEIHTRFGKVNCLEFMPLVISDRVFEDEESVRVWITDDDNKIPVRIQAKLMVGSLNLDIINYSNLANRSPFPN